MPNIDKSTLYLSFFINLDKKREEIGGDFAI
jgi:hypothetical protein